MKNWRR